MQEKETPDATEPTAKQPKVAAPKSFDTVWTVFTKWSQVETTDAQVVAVWESRDSDGRFVAQITQPTEGKLRWTLNDTAKRAKAIDAGEATTIGGAVRAADRAARKVLKARARAMRAEQDQARARKEERLTKPVGPADEAFDQVEERLSQEMEAMR
jgi:hypothetical protein